jgi:hypothetical protein
VTQASGQSKLRLSFSVSSVASCSKSSAMSASIVRSAEVRLDAAAGRVTNAARIARIVWHIPVARRLPVRHNELVSATPGDAESALERRCEGLVSAAVPGPEAAQADFRP